MSDEPLHGELVRGDGEADTLRARLECLGDAHETLDWVTGEVDYVTQLGLTAADVPELISIARAFAEPGNWPEDESDMSGYAPIHAWRSLAQLGATEAIGPLLEMMDPLSEVHDDWYLEEFPHVFALIGPTSMAAVREYLADDRHKTYARCAAASGLRELAKRHGHLRSDVVKVLGGILERFEKEDLDLNGLIVADLLDLKAAEAAEVIERAHAADRVDLTVCGNWEDVRKELGVPGLGLVPESLAKKKVSLFPMFDAALEKAGLDRESLFRGLGGIGEDDDLAPVDRADAAEDYLNEAAPIPRLEPAKKAGRNDPCPCGSGKKYKKCCLR
jgi:hypothetical protein